MGAHTNRQPGRFGHHDDFTIDYRLEVEHVERLASAVVNGKSTKDELIARMRGVVGAGPFIKDENRELRRNRLLPLADAVQSDDPSALARYLENSNLISLAASHKT